jgi:hypothetical protein
MTIADSQSRRASLWAALAVATAIVLVAFVAGARGASTPRAPLQRVTIIGDSVADALEFVPAARAILAKGVDLKLELAVCRRIVAESCPYNGVKPPNVLQVIQSLGPALGRTAIMDVGYNDDEEGFAQDITTTLDALGKAGVKRVIWVTFRATQHQYIGMNDTIRAAAAEHSQLRVVDWNLYSRSHPDWFGADGLHLHPPGAKALASFLHVALVDAGALLPPVRITAGRLTDVHTGRPYRGLLAADGGKAPYRWSVQGLPSGLRVAPSGTLSGLTRAPAETLALTVSVADATGQTATRLVTLRIRP